MQKAKRRKVKKKLKKERKKKIITVLALYKVRLGNLKLLWVQPSHGAGTGKKMSFYLLKRCLRETLGLTFMNSITLWAGEKKIKEKMKQKKPLPGWFHASEGSW